MKLLQITDLHLLVPGVRLFGIDPLARLEACIADINRHHGDAVFCALTGDLADDGARQAYESLRTALAQLAVPAVLMIGNHDERATFLEVFPEAGAECDGFVQRRISTAAGVCIFLDTVEDGKGWGSFCAARAAWLEAELDAAGAQPVYLFLHHPPFEIGIPSLDRIRLRDPAHLERVLVGRSNLRHLFLGHVHRPVSGTWKGIPFSASRSLVHQVVFDLETPAPVPKNREAPTYAVAWLQEDLTLVHLHDFLDESRIPLAESVHSRGASFG